MIKDIFKDKKPTLSFEVFPPKKEDDFANAFSVMDALAVLKPDFISVTYGAGGSKSKKTLEIASYIQNRLHIDALAHMTCVGSSREDIDAVASQMEQEGIRQVLALRGDRPATMSDEQFNSRAFAHASDLIAYLKANTSLHMAGACYPEKHFEAESFEEDLRHLKEKCEAGAEFLITQLFFDNDSFLRFRETAGKAGISVPICAGIMPITTAKQIGTTVSLSGSSVPKKMADMIAAYADNPADLRKAGIEYAAEQIRGLKAEGVDGIHIYTMNRPKVAAEIVGMI
ncbi:MAG TPA: methylenetetrahydrofolate reductase [NAD(P)H] [Candidatus Eisenbergiella merdipullorum]|uniref:Methylenetetrahydrofolate reductase n=1 Tax=Candidatus Eisenbergiella merdipullorum TaxID=2838553 RepID=A0A9D2L2G8_9FIRM|nr:methylenetetrahydrofolate reductase [NAD(P)H] [Candidatus Eisenbergiella merdipullorum]